MGSLLPLTNEEPKFLQIYFMGDEQMEARQRCSNILSVNHDIVVQLQTLLHDYNNYISSFKTAIENMPSDDFRIIIRAEKNRQKSMNADLIHPQKIKLPF